jgi:hypothetical protein
MSLPGASGAAGLPVVNQALEPDWVRRGSKATQQDYATALAFEKVLVEQLTKSLAATSGLGGESSEEGEPGAEGGASAGAQAGSGELSSLLPQALSAGVMSAGGLGLAAQLTHGIEGVRPASRAAASGGTAA